MPSLSELAPLLTALLVGGGLVAIIDYLKTRHTVRINNSLAQRIQDSQVEAADLVNIQTKLVTLSSGYDSLAKENARLRSQLEEAENREAKKTIRIRELEDEIDKIRKRVREAEIEAAQTREMCENLTRQIREIQIEDSQ